VSLRADPEIPVSAFDLLRHTYRFASEEWQHANRETSPDQGFEQRFRESCVLRLREWSVSQPREMGLGMGLETASGVLHEVDLVGTHSDAVAVFELKNRRAFPPEKNDAIVFFAKLLDYLARNPTLLFREVIPLFLSAASFEPTGLATCLGLGLHPVAPGLRPFPLLCDSARRMIWELRQDLVLPQNVREEFDDFCALLNRIGVALEGTWLGRRCGYQSEGSIVVKAIVPPDSHALADDFRRANADCGRLLEAFRVLKARQQA
jgi:hypothetical protein